VEYFHNQPGELKCLGPDFDVETHTFHFNTRPMTNMLTTIFQIPTGPTPPLSRCHSYAHHISTYRGRFSIREEGAVSDILRVGWTIYLSRWDRVPGLSNPSALPSLRIGHKVWYHTVDLPRKHVKYQSCPLPTISN
jgi:hypothetical protein